MAVIWQKQVDGKRYEVRSAGNSIRLYTEGVFHSQFNPHHSLTGNVWDLISLPAFFMEQAQVRRVLVLGVGGGAVIRQLHRWYPGCEIVGVELDATHLYLARRFFGLKSARIELIEADAIQWVERYRGLGFDLIIDDLFSEQEGEPYRVVAASKQWADRLGKLLTPAGTIVMNFLSGRDLRASSFFHNKHLKNKYKQIFRLMTPLYENNIGVFLRTASSVNILRKHIKEHTQVASEYFANQDKYQIRKLAG